MESSLENIINATTDQLTKVSISDIQQRHRKERKELQAKIQSLKKNAPKSDKKKRKEALDEIFKLEADLEKKQLLEMQQAEFESKSKINTAEETNKEENNSVDNEEPGEDNHKRVSKAQKRREKKAKEAKQREEEIKAYEEEAIYAPKTVEAQKLSLKLKERNLALFNIPSDGDCLYNAIRHQLLQHDLSDVSIKELRSEAANYIQSNKDSLIHYMTHQETGNLLTEDEFKRYCDDIRNTSSWGGQIELKALSSVLKVPIVVLQGDGSPTLQGAEFSGIPLVITYHRHLYSLGEHYNSTIPTTDAASDDNNENDGA